VRILWYPDSEPMRLVRAIAPDQDIGEERANPRVEGLRSVRSVSPTQDIGELE